MGAHPGRWGRVSVLYGGTGQGHTALCWVHMAHRLGKPALLFCKPQLFQSWSDFLFLTHFFSNTLEFATSTVVKSKCCSLQKGNLGVRYCHLRGIRPWQTNNPNSVFTDEKDVNVIIRAYLKKGSSIFKLQSRYLPQKENVLLLQVTAASLLFPECISEHLLEETAYPHLLS